MRSLKPVDGTLLALLAVLPATHSMADVCLPTWEQRTLPGDRPAPRAEHALAYDAARGTVVLDGGLGSFDYEPDTWIYDGEAWLELPAPGEFGSGHALAYDAARERTVEFGGNFVTGLGFDAPDATTREWDGADWILRSTGFRPEPRFDHGLAYDAARGEVVLHGGECGNACDAPTFDLPNSTWEWDGTSWVDRGLAGPNTENAAVAYDAARDQVVLFGGAVGSLEKGETWVFDGLSWQLVSASGPSPRRGAAMAYDSVRERVILYGGEGDGGVLLGDTWSWDGDGWVELPIPGPSPRTEHALAFDAGRDRTVLFGGDSGGFFPTSDETWELVWSCPTLELPPLIRTLDDVATVSGLTEGDEVRLAYSLIGEGDGPCPPQLGGRCLELLPPVGVLGTAFADVDGVATFPLSVPDAPGIAELSLQAAVVRGPDSELTDARTVAVVEPQASVEATLDHRGGPSLSFGWGYRIDNSTATPEVVDVAVVQERPDCSQVVLELRDGVSVDPFGSVELSAVLSDRGQASGVHRVRARITDPVSGETLDEGAARVRVLGLDGSGDDAPVGACGPVEGGVAEPDLSVTAQVEPGGSWQHFYVLSNFTTAEATVSTQVVLDGPAGTREVVSGPTERTLAVGDRVAISADYPIAIDATLGSYQARVEVIDAGGAIVFASPDVSFKLVAPMP